MAQKVSEYLNANGVLWKTFAVNCKYFDVENSENIVVLEDYIDKNECALIVAFKDYNSQMLNSLNLKNVKKIYALDFQGRFASECDSMISREYLMLNYEKLKILVAHLSDSESKESLKAFIHQKMYSEYEKPFSRFRQYFEEGIIEFKDQECFVDCGGFDAEDTFFFLKQMKRKKGKAYIFEPDPENYENIQRKLGNDDRVTIINRAVSDSDSCLRFAAGMGASSKIDNKGDKIVEVCKLDDILSDEKITFLKMDIEGFELQALHGSEKLIRRCRPKLAICVYHRKEDLFTIPQYILSIHSDYKLYVRNYHSTSTETVLYAI